MISTTKIVRYVPSIFQEYIECYQFYYFNDKTVLDLNPDGNFELIFQLKGSFSQKSCTNDEWIIRPQNFVGGLHSKSFQIKSLQKNARILSIKFKPLGARSFIHDRLNLFKNQLIDLQLLKDNLTELDLENVSDQIIINSVESYLKRIYREQPKNVIDHTVEQLIYSKGFLSIGSLSDRFNISKSHLRLLFNEQVGMSPKEYSKILRIKYIHTLLKTDSSYQLTQLAHQLGYYDQAHFIKDFQSVTGLTPGKYSKIK